jgi:hypothetical protein
MLTSTRTPTGYLRREDFNPNKSRNSAKSLRRLASELSVSVSYLSKINNGKCKASKRLLNMLSKIEGNNRESVTMVGHCGLEPQTPVLSGLCSNQLS